MLEGSLLLCFLLPVGGLKDRGCCCGADCKGQRAKVHLGHSVIDFILRVTHIKLQLCMKRAIEIKLA